MNADDKTKVVSIAMPAEMAYLTLSVAHERGISRSALVREAIGQALDPGQDMEHNR